MDIQTFDQVSAPLRSEMAKVGIATPTQERVLDLQRGPFSHANAYATMWQYFHMTPDVAVPIRFEEVTGKMKQALGDWDLTDAAITRLHDEMNEPARAPMLSGTKGVQWDNMLAEFDRRIISAGPGTPECRAALVEAAQLGQQGKLLQTLAQASKAAKDAAQKNARIFELLQAKRPRVLDEDYAPATAIGGMAAGYGLAAGVGAGAFGWQVVQAGGVAAAAAGTVSAISVGLIIGGVGMCGYGLYLLSTLRR